MPVKIHRRAEPAFARYLAARASVPRSALALAFEPSRAVDPLLLVEGKQFYPPMLEDIASATSSIHINEFGIRPGAVAGRFTEVLEAKVREGVPVRVLVDSRGSRPDGDSLELFARWAAAGIEVLVNRAFDLNVPVGPLGSDRGRRWNLRNLFAVDHRKALVIDGRIGWVGTAGIEDRFEDGRHHDLFVRFEGPVVHQLQAVFLASYRWLGGIYSTCEVPRLFPAVLDGSPGVPAVVLHNAPGPYRPISDAIIELTSSARDRLDIMNPYVAHPGMFRLLIETARRGVKVRLVVPPNQHTWATGYARLYHHEDLSDAGVEVWTYPAVAHAKAFVRDDAEVLVGSCNLESWSLHRFFEMDVRIQSPDLVHQFRTKLFDPDIAVSIPAQPADGIKEQILSRALYLVSPLL